MPLCRVGGAPHPCLDGLDPMLVLALALLEMLEPTMAKNCQSTGAGRGKARTIDVCHCMRQPSAIPRDVCVCSCGGSQAPRR